MKDERIDLEKIDDFRWKINRSGDMRVDGLIYLSEKMLESVRGDASLVQVRNVATLPGIKGFSIAMPDIHWGYGFPIGGVAAFTTSDGIISPGGVGYDINCGVRLLLTGFKKDEIAKRIDQIVNLLFRNIPSGVGSSRKDFKISKEEMKEVLTKGARWAVERNFGTAEDLDFIEDNGEIKGAEDTSVSERAIERGRDQLGTLGSGNHFIEVGYVDSIFDKDTARAFGLEEGLVTILIHTGSRGLGYQVCDDYIKLLLEASKRYGIFLPDRQLCCAPITSEEGKRYLGAMRASANFAFANRQIITHWVRQTFEKVFQQSYIHLGMKVLYDVAHNIAKIEKHTVEGKEVEVCVHRKGATRSFPKGSPDIPEKFRKVGQPVLIPGDMGRYSFVLVGGETAMKETFGSTCHGAGRLMSRGAAMKAAKGRGIVRELSDKGIIVQSASKATLIEEIPEAYKDVEDVVDVVSSAGISRKVARLRPWGVIKG